jgi:hypothetical protein
MVCDPGTAHQLGPRANKNNIRFGRTLLNLLYVLIFTYYGVIFTSGSHKALFLCSFCLGFVKIQ